MSEDSSGTFEPGTPAEASPFASLYDRAVESLLNVPVVDEWVDTKAGQTHLLTAGDVSAPPVIVFQGGNVTNPVTLAWVQALADDHYLVAPDTPGQPGKTAVDSPPEYGPWVVDVLDRVGLERAAMVGTSHGAGVLLETAAHAPDRIDAAALLVPSGFGTPLSVGLLRIVVPSLGYRVLPGQQLLRWALTPMFTQPVSSVDDCIIETISMALRTGDLTADFPGPDDPSDLAAFEAPALVITGEYDPFFPGKRTCKRAAQTLPSVRECVLLTGECHFLSPDGQARATERVRAFLDRHSPNAE
jgi:pimeloyl-ACP methyl ester carboxylesterase